MNIRKADHEDEPGLLVFMEAIDEEYSLPLSARVDLGQWLKKVLKLGMILVSVERQNLNGVIAFYCNDKDNRQAFISCLSVAKSARRQGSVLVTTPADNRPAMTLYETCGFKEDDTESRQSGEIALRLIL